MFVSFANYTRYEAQHLNFSCICLLFSPSNRMKFLKNSSTQTQTQWKSDFHHRYHHTAGLLCFNFHCIYSPSEVVLKMYQLKQQIPGNEVCAVFCWVIFLCLGPAAVSICIESPVRSTRISRCLNYMHVNKLAVIKESAYFTDCWISAFQATKLDQPNCHHREPFCLSISEARPP